MVTPTTGSIILIPFPFSDLSQSKIRPAVVLADAMRDSNILRPPYSQLFDLPVQATSRAESYSAPTVSQMLTQCAV